MNTTYIGQALLAASIGTALYHIVHPDTVTWETRMVSSLSLMAANRLLTPVTYSVLFVTSTGLAALRVISVLHRNQTAKDVTEKARNRSEIANNLFLLALHAVMFVLSRRRASQPNL